MSVALAPTLLEKDEALNLIETTIKKSQAEGIFVKLTQNASTLSRFCENQISQNINCDRFTLEITSYFGKRSASAATTELDEAAIAQAIKRSEELAEFAPEDPEWVELLPPQTYQQHTPAFNERTATLSPLTRGKMVKRVCAMSAKVGVNASGTLSTDTYLKAVGNSLGLRACDRTTKADFSFTAKSGDGSSWGHNTAFAMSNLPIEKITEEVIERALASRHPRAISPGIYPVVFNGAAFASLLPWVTWNLDARAADEGRSFMAGKDGSGNRLGEQMFSPLVQVKRDPHHPLIQGSTFFSDGLSNNPLTIIQDGIPKTLAYSRYWGQRQGQQATGGLYPIVMAGSHQSLADLIAQTERGIFVNRAWYVRYVNPRTLEVTGMTRDGTFWIEDGKIAYPIKNLRFNQLLPQMLADVEGVSRVQRFDNTVVPGVKVKAFNFSSVTDSV
ncbi:MAG: TldD/PmbA family protein [Spirulinaceae cyanobacterium]